MVDSTSAQAPDQAAMVDGTSAVVELRPAADASVDSLAAEYPEYVDTYKRALTLAAENGFRDLERLGIVRAGGLDKDGRDVYLFYPQALQEDTDLELVTMLALHLMHGTVVRQSRPYTVVWVCNNQQDSRLSFWWFRRTYRMLPQAYKKQMRQLCVVHPGVQVRIQLYLLSFVVSASFWEKLFYADRIEFLDEVRRPARPPARRQAQPSAQPPLPRLGRCFRRS